MKRKAKAVGKRILGFFVMIGGILLMAGGVIMFVGGILYFFVPAAEAPEAPLYLVWAIAAIAILGGFLVFAFGIGLLFNL